MKDIARGWELRLPCVVLPYEQFADFDASDEPENETATLHCLPTSLSCEPCGSCHPYVVPPAMVQTLYEPVYYDEVYRVDVDLLPAGYQKGREKMADGSSH